ncbi:MarR family winged helix-turn-helix transcriptional regulator [Salinibacterium hongtaonis]|uniref:Transcriptional regulator n=1 Tax=Homoserinimonas hongtaonis TaxID=2079791 RepID=A0A2U1T1I5_9MICO|nr:MarR family winged helix-turn-helix transcriptional regulator [Salinibacterium hongtaonis]PWB97728.1 transcriptional regulator [Salinibacterium hongtaonis]
MAERPIGFWLRTVDQLIDERFDAIIEEHGVTRRQWQLLGVIAEGKATVGDLDRAIAPFIDTDAGESALEQLDELVESDWVAVHGEHYELTERGHKAFVRLTEVVDSLRGSLAEGLTEDEYRTTVTSLERMARNLGFTGDESA